MIDEYSVLYILHSHIISGVLVLASAQYIHDPPICIGDKLYYVIELREMFFLLLCYIIVIFQNRFYLWIFFVLFFAERLVFLLTASIYHHIPSK